MNAIRKEIIKKLFESGVELDRLIDYVEELCTKNEDVKPTPNYSIKWDNGVGIMDCDNTKFSDMVCYGNPLECSFVDDYHEDYAVVQKHGKWSFIDTNGNFAFSDRWFDYAYPFNGGYAMVEVDGKEYYLRKDGVLCDVNHKRPINDKRKTR